MWNMPGQEVLDSCCTFAISYQIKRSAINIVNTTCPQLLPVEERGWEGLEEYIQPARPQSTVSRLAKQCHRILPCHSCQRTTTFILSVTLLAQSSKFLFLISDNSFGILMDSVMIMQISRLFYHPNL